MCLDLTWKNYTIENGKFNISWNSRGVKETPIDHIIGIKCGKCVECMNAASTEWANRCVLESKHHVKNCILTLTYKDAFNDNELHKRHYQLFLKKLRKTIFPTKIKYFCSGEYGDKTGRPHYHIVIFGWCPEDLTFVGKSKKGTALYNSKLLDSKWEFGWCVVDPNLTRQSCFYSAKYLQKAISEFGVKHKQSPFITMSKGIAEEDAKKYDPYTNNRIYIDGKECRAPRYFRKVYRKRVGEDWYTGSDIPHIVKELDSVVSFDNASTIARRYRSKELVQKIDNFFERKRMKRQNYLRLFGLRC